jgi:UDP-2,4-diacetamido-2,4,6-trideoxy-beta-L-altropyranose hydrolase
MHFLFRTDANTQIGTGHLMRCLALAEALRTEGSECTFLCRGAGLGVLAKKITDAGHAMLTLPEATENNTVADFPQLAHANWLPGGWQNDVAACLGRINGLPSFEWLIVDHYALDSRWEKAMRSKVTRIMVIDDLADRQHDCDLLLDQNLGRDASDYSQLVPGGSAVLVGPYYALLRPEFAVLRAHSLHRRSIPQFKHLLITMGGVDHADATGKVLEVLLDCTLPADMRITVVMGSHAPWLERVKLLAEQMPQPTEVKVNVNHMAQLMAESDLAIGAAGSTSWERCCLGLPTVIVVLAANQRNGAVALEQRGCVKLLDSVDDIPYALQSILSLLATADALTQLSTESCLVTDGQGTSRVKDFLTSHSGCIYEARLYAALYAHAT